MFTGIITAMGEISECKPVGGDVRLRVECADLAPQELHAGDSVAVNGVCLTVLAPDQAGFSADVSRETLDCTTLAAVAEGSKVNLEPALSAGAALGGHLVSGHVDGRARLLEMSEDARSWRLLLEAPEGLARYIAAKGSVCLDGVSLTVNEVQGNQFGVNIIPHTWQHTTLGQRAPGDELNLEVDLLARYLERLGQYGLAGGAAQDSKASGN